MPPMSPIPTVYRNNHNHEIRYNSNHNNLLGGDDDDIKGRTNFSHHPNCPRTIEWPG